MRLVERDLGWGGTERFDALIVGGGGGDAGEHGIDAVALAGGRIVDRIDWADAIERVRTIGGRPVLLLEAQNITDERLAGTLSVLDGLAAGRDLSIVVAIDERQIDIAAAGLMLSHHEILCAPQPADWIGVLACSHAGHDLRLHDQVGESETSRLARLNAEVARITNMLAQLSKRENPLPATVADGTIAYIGEVGAEPAVAAADIRQIVRARRMRDRFIGEGLFEDPAWDMMLDLYAAHLERAQVSVSSLCIAAAVAPTTALRWIARLTEARLFERRPDPFDRRRAFMSLSDLGLAAMHRYVATVRGSGLPLV